MTVKLLYPIMVFRLFKYVSIGEVFMRRPTLADMKGLDLTNPEKQQEAFKIMISRVTDISVKDLEKIDLKDWMTISNTFNSMTGNTK